ncbi:hypothetical protein Pse7367_3790 (plasmid) [Thalassoporum mexicanum PCC 7367]|uniref:hypothetical protein n=1 Tax=Thalassoporum mexicanum TaxID=3457544 RepID=UPI00029F9771|nr:hypothetical protein [Pseudanabaena sp. PCC 7367]AFY72014.1 hypothetical protein Pse7367_3790 [Pseudanabaena sp. PCC 7367]
MSNPTASKTPALVAYTVKERDGDKSSVWKEIGAAWPHKDGEGYEVMLDAFPVNGRLTLRKPTPKDTNTPESESSAD